MFALKKPVMWVKATDRAAHLTPYLHRPHCFLLLLFRNTRSTRSTRRSPGGMMMLGPVTVRALLGGEQLSPRREAPLNGSERR